MNHNIKIIICTISVIGLLIAWQIRSYEQIPIVYEQNTLAIKYLGDSRSLITPIPESINLNPNIVALGEKLFHETKLSNSQISCHHCHNLQQAGVDGLRVSINVQGGSDHMNTPTVFNSGFNFRLRWNGKAETLEDQLEHVIHNPKHMNSSWPEIIQRLSNDAHYSREFNQIYADGLTPTNIKNALATFERALITPNSSFDQYLKGNDNAITEDQKAGYFLFQQYGCVACHQGVLVGGNLFARFGVFNDPFANKTHFTETDLGRYAYTKNDEDKHVFKVPGLRNVAETAPYFHDGRAATLETAIWMMAWIQLGRDIPQSDVYLIAEFLQSLSGVYSGAD